MTDADYENEIRRDEWDELHWPSEDEYPDCDECSETAFATVFEEDFDGVEFPTLCRRHCEAYAAEAEELYISKRYPKPTLLKSLQERLEGADGEIGDIELIDVGVGWGDHIDGVEVPIGFYDDRERPGRRYRHNIAWNTSGMFATLEFNGNKWTELDALQGLINAHLGITETWSELEELERDQNE